MQSWLEPLRVIADFQPPTYWHMTNGAEFWWTIDRSMLGEIGFTTQPFTYDNIEAVTVFNELRWRDEVISCDWPALRQRLLEMKKLSFEELLDVRLGGLQIPNEAIRLTLLG